MWQQCTRSMRVGLMNQQRLMNLQLRSAVSATLHTHACYRRKLTSHSIDAIHSACRNNSRALYNMSSSQLSAAGASRTSTPDQENTPSTMSSSLQGVPSTIHLNHNRLLMMMMKRHQSTTSSDTSGKYSGRRRIFENKITECIWFSALKIQQKLAKIGKYDGKIGKMGQQ